MREYVDDIRQMRTARRLGVNAIQRPRTNVSRPDSAPPTCPPARSERSAGRLRIAVGVPTSGRPAILSSVVDCVRRQTRAPDSLVVCASRPADLAGLDLAAAGGVCLISPRGLTRQRNSILDHSRDCDILIFFDDDFLPHARYLEMIEQAFLANSDVVMITGRVLADGITGPGLSAVDALCMLDCPDLDGRYIASPDITSGALLDVHNGYGCNMSVRLSALQAACLKFDEALPLYGWLEDVDFSRRLAPYGRIVKCPMACGVHLGVKSGRQSGIRLGYSQIANPIYLTRKGTLATHRALRQIARNVAMNVARSLWSERHVDRRGRLWGNLLGAADLVMNKLEPQRVLRIGESTSSFRD
jgi:hypothetical protein